jgi:hypothetical protein
MAGDYKRYICEITTGDKFENAKHDAMQYYDEANLIEIPCCSPVKLGLALN